MTMTPILCPCGSGFAYPHCCEPFHAGEKIPLTAEALMRSRFVAFCLQNAAYLLATWDVASRPATLDFYGDTTEWLRLEITGTKKGGIHDRKGTVSFNAHYRHDRETQVLSETSRFNKIQNRWFYVDGIININADDKSPAQGRNAPCACGSAKKFKRCCGA
jgi:SEC-C motif-containing protein